MSGDTFTVALRRVFVSPNSVPKPVHRFFWTRVGMDVLLDVGYFDLTEVGQALERAKVLEVPATPEVPFYITDRFFVSPAAVPELYKAVGELMQDLRSSGLLPQVDKTSEPS